MTSMKILLFNLGTIEDRIIDWGIEGFKSLFEQDIILWGPITDKNFIYKEKEIPILSFFEPTTISDVFNKLPKDWYPDIVTCDTSVLNYIPDIYKCQVKTILFTRDAWSDTIFNKGLVELFDFVNHATIDRSFYNTFHVNVLPLSNFAVSIPVPGIIQSEYEKRDIDVIAIANYNKSFYHNRYKTFYQLSDLNRTGINIKYFLGIKRPEIYTYYQRSKIVIDWAHTLSNRSYEAALNGCLLFSHKDNPLIKEFWIPWEEYIPYDESNIMELISFYLNNPEDAKRVINKAQEKIQRTPASWGEYAWYNINVAFNTEVSIQERISRNESTPTEVLHYRTSTPLVYNYDYSTNFPPEWKELYFERIDYALSASNDTDFIILPLIEAARMAFLLKRSELSLKYLNELENVLPDYAWIYYLYARIFFENNDNQQALIWLKKSIDCALKSPELLQQFVLPVIEKGNACDGRRVIDFMWQPVYKHNNEFQVKSLLHLTYELSGEIYIRIHDQNKAVNAYSEAIHNIPVPDCIYKVNPLLIQRRDYETMLQLTEKGIADSPYDSILILYKAYALIQLKQKHNFVRVLKEHKKALKSFIGIRKFLILRNLISIILISSLLSKSLSSKIIIEILKLLKKKEGFSYLG
jgi:tetratricopeptide (TPR) repeat protein